MMEWPSGHEASSGCRASRKRRTNFARRPDRNPEPRTVGQNAPTNLADYAGGRILRSHRSDVHLNMPPGFESYGLPSESHISSGENHEDRSKEPLLESGHLGNQNKLKQLKHKLDSITRPPESHMRSGKNHEDGLREPFLESGCLGNEKKLKKLKRKLDGITHPLHKAALQIASGSRVTVTRRSSNVVGGCVALLKQKRYDWQPEHARQVRLNFEARGMARLRDFFCVARKNVNVRPLWLSSEVWDALKQYWDSPEFKSKSEQAKINRASDCDGLGPSKHTCGSIPMSEHKRRLEEKTGEEVTPIKLFVHTHQRRDKTWVDSRSAQAYEKFMKEWNKLHSSQPASQLSGSEGEGQTSAQPTQPADPVLAEAELWVKTNSTKRGTIYGLGSEAVKYKSFGSSNPSTSEPIHRTTPNWFDTPEFQQLLSQKVTEVSSEWNARLEQERRATEELQKRVAELEREKREKKEKKKAKKKLNQMKEMMEMLQKQYESLSKGQPSSDDDDDDDDDGSSDSD